MPAIRIGFVIRNWNADCFIAKTYFYLKRHESKNHYEMHVQRKIWPTTSDLFSVLKMVLVASILV